MPRRITTDAHFVRIVSILAQIDGEIDLEATIDEEAQLSDGHDSDAFDSEGSEVAHDDQLVDSGDKPTPEVRGSWVYHRWTDNLRACVSVLCREN